MLRRLATLKPERLILRSIQAEVRLRAGPSGERRIRREDSRPEDAIVKRREPDVLLCQGEKVTEVMKVSG